MKKIFLCGLILFCNSAFADECASDTLFITDCDGALVGTTNYHHVDFCSFCSSRSDACVAQDMDDNNSATMPSSPDSGYFCCIGGDNKVYVYNGWRVYSFYKTEEKDRVDFGEKLTVDATNGLFAVPIAHEPKSDSEIGKNGQCVDGVYSACPQNQKCENGVAKNCTVGKYCENGVEQDCPSGHFCENGEKNPCPDGSYCLNGVKHTCPVGYYCTNGVKTQCRETSYCPAGSSSEQKCPTGYKCVGGEKTACNTAGYYCEGGTEQKCPTGFYCTGDGYKQACPVPSKSDVGADAKTDCYIISSTRFCDGNGNCFDLGDIDKINEKIFIKN